MRFSIRGEFVNLGLGGGIVNLGRHIGSFVGGCVWNFPILPQSCSFWAFQPQIAIAGPGGQRDNPGRTGASGWGLAVHGGTMSIRTTGPFLAATLGFCLVIRSVAGQTEAEPGPMAKVKTVTARQVLESTFAKTADART